VAVGEEGNMRVLSTLGYLSSEMCAAEDIRVMKMSPAICSYLLSG